MVRLQSVLDDIMAAHAYPPAIANVLAEALCLCALLGGLVKNDEGQLTMQAQTENGPITLLVCDYRHGELRGYVDFDPDRLAEQPEQPSLMSLFGKGFLAITFDQPPPLGRHQGIVPLEGANLAEAVQNFLTQSEQIPTIIRTSASRADGHACTGGILVQYFPRGEEGRERLHVQEMSENWQHIAVMSASLSDDELLDTSLPIEDVLWRLFSFSDEVSVLSGKSLIKGCRCNEQHIRDVIARFPKEDRDDMVSDAGNIVVDCKFCSRDFVISAASLRN